MIMIIIIVAGNSVVNPTWPDFQSNTACYLCSYVRVHLYIHYAGTLCTSLITHVFDLHLMQMKADGFIEKEWEAHLARTATQTCMEETDKASNIEDETLSLSIHEMAGIFIVHAFLMMVAVLVSLVQYFRARKRKEGRHEE